MTVLEQDSASESAEQLFDMLEKQGIAIPDEYRKQIHAKVEGILGYEPLVGVFGKTGAGKSSLCNALFGKDVCAISDVEACTRKKQEVALSLGSKGLRLVDVPGIAESKDRDAEYIPMYKSLLPKLDLVLWVLKGDERAYGPDEDAYRELIRANVKKGAPFFVVLNQVDRIEPFRQWDSSKRRPGTEQNANIQKKRQYVAGIFKIPLEKVIAVSAEERFGLIELVDAIVHALPNEKKAAFTVFVEKENVSRKAQAEAKDGLAETIVDTIIDIIPVPAPIKTILKAGARKVIGWLFG
jgi:uncharacterized protein